MSVVLYDLPSRQGTCWSLNPWKTRMALNIKGADYKTEWIPYPDLASTFKALGIPPNKPDEPGYFGDYTSPAVSFVDGKNNTYVMDSWKIIKEVESRYPSPSLHLDDPIVVQVRDAIGGLMGPIRGVLVPKVPRYLLNERCVEYFERTREASLGKPLSQYEKDAGGEDAWQKAEPPAKDIAQLLKKQGGPFFRGKEVSYADVIFVSFLQFMKRLDSEIFERYLAFDPAFSEIYNASKQWLVKED
ncbi:glutathione S-transferas-like protein [Polyplosphaeria fusca]|uniref:Glutathione S-transferas-like protein n=1 Tax=Polyplosphaeria fusca TaxID=682080 RepID=A0A9P4V2D2_9PLEO|nr:glutathione S-transferas-like protein [Polyplosphaeria fusca]